MTSSYLLILGLTLVGTLAVLARELKAKLKALVMPAVGGRWKPSAAPMAAVFGRLPPYALYGKRLIFLLLAAVV
jgi:hypothetical protein